MSSEIWGSKSETYEGIHDFEEGLYKKNNSEEENYVALEYWLDELEEENKIELGTELIEKSKEIIKFIEKKRELLCLDESFFVKDFTEIQTFSQSTCDEIIQGQEIENIQLKLKQIEIVFEELKILYNKIKNKLTQESNSIAIIVGVNFSSEIKHLLSSIKDPNLKEEYNDKYLVVVNKIIKEYLQNRERFICREIFLKFYSEVSLIIRMQKELNNANDKVDMYNVAPRKNQNLYLNENNYVDISEYELKICEILLDANFDSLLKGGTKKTTDRIIQYPSIDRYYEQTTLMARRKETKTFSDYYDLNPKNFFEKNADTFCYMINSNNGENFITAMERFIEKLKNNKIKVHSEKIIETKDIGIQLEKEFLYFLIVNLYRLKNNVQDKALNYISSNLNNDRVDFEILFTLLDMKTFDKNGSYDKLINYQIGLMTPEEKNMFSKYLNVSQTNDITKSNKKRN